MILQEATYFKYGYYPYALSPQSSKRILAKCDGCRKVRVTSKNEYRALCRSCAATGNRNCLGHNHTDETKRKISDSLIGLLCESKNPNWKGGKIERICEVCGKTFYVNLCVVKIGAGNCCSRSCAKTDEKNHNFGKRGTETSRWKGGTIVAEQSHYSKRRSLGFTALNAPFEGAEGHHLTHNFVMYIPKALHRSIWHNMHTSKNMYEVNALALDFLLNSF